MKKSAPKEGFLSAVYEEKTHEDLHTYLPKGHRAIGTKWVFRNKKDEMGIVIRNKARLVAQGHTQEEGIDYDEVFSPVARIEAIILFLAYASFIGFMGDESTVWSASSTKGMKELCTEFEKLMKDKFQMSSTGELTFFLGLQVQQKKVGIFISQEKYVDGILKKFNYTDVKSASTLVDLERPLVKDKDGTDVDEHLYRSMIRSSMYLIASRPDIMLVVCVCARFQVTPKTSHLIAVKRIFRYLKGKPTLCLWYSRDSPFELVAYTDSDYAGAIQDRKSTTRVAMEKYPGYQTNCWIIGDNGQVQLIATIDGHVKTITEASLRRHLKLEENGGETSPTNSEIFKQLALMGYVTDSDKLTFQKGNFSPHWRFLIYTILHGLSPKKTSWEQFNSNVASAIICLATNRTYNFSKMIFDAMVKNVESPHKFLMYPRITSSPSLSPEPLLLPHHTITSAPSTSHPPPHDSPLHSVNSHGSDEGRMQQTNLIDLVTTLIYKIEVLEKDLQQNKKTYSTTFTKLIFRVKILEKQVKKISDIDEDPNFSLVQVEDMTWFEEDALAQENGEKYEREVSTISTAGVKLSTGKNGVNTASRSISTVDVSTAAEKAKEKGKGIMIELEPRKKLKKRVEFQLSIDEELARKIQEEDPARAIAEQEQERINFEAALELQRQLDERQEVPA
ncbi:putative ribonuclease H-like domain-containing protein [Tanacetum coccineum]